MASRDKPPFRADHVGSLLRPPELTRARADLKAGRIDAVALRAIEDDAIRGVIELMVRQTDAARPTRVTVNEAVSEMLQVALRGVLA